MADSLLGGDPAQMNDLAGMLTKRAAEIDSSLADVRARANKVTWTGKDADSFRKSEVDGRLRKAADAAVAQLRSGEKTLTAQAQAQQEASSS